MKRQKGFTLIELLIVVAIILIIAAIAVPNLLKARTAANEASAVGTIRAVNTSEMVYFTTYGVGFAPLIDLGGALPCAASMSSACLIDNGIAAGGTKSGYLITTTAPGAVGTSAAPNPTYVVQALPQTVGQTGTRAFCSDASGVIRVNMAGAGCSVTADAVLQ